MRVDPLSGIVGAARWVASPNYDERPPGLGVEVIIIHAISLPPGEFGGPYVEQLFCNRLDPEAHSSFHEIQSLKVSAHLFINRAGEVTQFVPLNKRAWHAGESLCEGRKRVNDFSVGIELEGCDNKPFEEVQYDVLADLSLAIMQAYPAVTPARIYGHADIAPGRKTDPGPFFDWERYRAACR